MLVSELVQKLSKLPLDATIVLQVKEPYDKEAEILSEVAADVIHDVNSNIVTISDGSEAPDCEYEQVDGQPKVFQFCLTGWAGDTDAKDHLMKWVKAPTLASVEAFIAANGLKVEGSIDDDLDPKWGPADGVDVILDAEGNVIEGEICKTKLPTE